MKLIKVNRKLTKQQLKEIYECKYCEGREQHEHDCFLRSHQMISTDIPSGSKLLIKHK